MQRKILPLLASALEFGSAPSSAIGSLLKIGQTLTNEQFQEKVLPTVTRLFSSPDRQIRIQLLSNLQQFEETISNKVADEQIFPSLASGFQDSSPYLREV